eukprot:354906-Prorocentrum_minimum.AAC.1
MFITVAARRLGREPVLQSRVEPVRLRHRVLFHDGVHLQQRERERAAGGAHDALPAHAAHDPRLQGRAHAAADVCVLAAQFGQRRHLALFALLHVRRARHAALRKHAPGGATKNKIP